MNLPIEPVEVEGVVYMRCPSGWSGTFQRQIGLVQQNLQPDTQCALFAPAPRTA